MKAHEESLVGPETSRVLHQLTGRRYSENSAKWQALSILACEAFADVLAI